jgi:hypothetical protein
MNAKEVLANVEKFMKESEEYKAQRGRYKKFKIWDICEELGIFDWWPNELSYSQLKQMRSFLKTAISLEFEGYACFKVGSSGCANGMWVHKAESKDGYSPDGACIYHSFVSDYRTWDLCDNKENWLNDIFNRYDFTLKEVKQYIKDHKEDFES